MVGSYGGGRSPGVDLTMLNNKSWNVVPDSAFTDFNIIIVQCKRASGTQPTALFHEGDRPLITAMHS